MPLTLFDGIVIAVIVISALLAMVRGFVREVLSVASWVAAAAAAYLFYEPVVPLVSPYIESTTVATIVAAALIFFVALIIASYITMKISDFVIDSRIGVFDRLLGFVFGAARGFLILVIAFLFFDWLVAQPPPWIADSATRPMLQSAGKDLIAALPTDIEATILQRLRGESDGPPADLPADPSVGPDEPAEGAAPLPGYGSSERQGLEQLIENNAEPDP